jgi:hypothetical protein
MDTNTIDKAEIAAQLRNMTEEVLFGDKPWPIDNNAAVHQQLLDWGLVEECEITISATGEIVERPKSPDSKKGDICFHTTALGRELDVDRWIMLMGHHEPAEIPDILVQMGALTKEEADHIVLDRWERDGEKLEDVLPPILRRLYRVQSQ